MFREYLRHLEIMHVTAVTLSNVPTGVPSCHIWSRNGRRLCKQTPAPLKRTLLAPHSSQTRILPFSRPLPRRRPRRELRPRAPSPSHRRTCAALRNAARCRTSSKQPVAVNCGEHGRRVPLAPGLVPGQPVSASPSPFPFLLVCALEFHPVAVPHPRAPSHCQARYDTPSQPPVLRHRTYS